MRWDFAVAAAGAGASAVRLVLGSMAAMAARLWTADSESTIGLGRKGRTKLAGRLGRHLSIKTLLNMQIILFTIGK